MLARQTRRRVLNPEFRILPQAYYNMKDTDKEGDFFAYFISTKYNWCCNAIAILLCIKGTGTVEKIELVV